jgi:acyl dehydratase
VYPGDRLRCRLTVIDATPSRSRPFMGSVRQRGEVLNQKDEVVLSLIGTSFFRRRPA